MATTRRQTNKVLLPLLMDKVAWVLPNFISSRRRSTE